MNEDDGWHAAPGGPGSSRGRPEGPATPEHLAEPGSTQWLPTVRADEAGEPAQGPPGISPWPPGRAKRFWSARRVPAAVTALLGMLGTGILLYDVAAVRAGRQAMAWRSRLAQELATRPLDDVWVLTGAAVATALGLWLLVLALTPGLRKVLPLRLGPGRIRAGLDRDAAALVLRDRALEVPGVRSARVAVSRRRAKVRVDSHFRELDDVRDDLDEVLGDANHGLGLERRLRLAVSLRRAGKG